MKYMSFDVRPIPSVSDIPFTARYMEAKVMEDFRLLNEITENYSLGYLSESGALAMLDMIDKDEYRLMEVAVEAADALHDMTLEDALNIDTPHSFGFVGEGVLPFKDIIKANGGESIYNAYTLERTWDNSSVVGQVATRVANSKEADLNLYKESEGTKGFTVFERDLYKSYPDDRIEPGFLYERAIDGAILSGALSLEDGFITKDFVRTRFLANENVAAMMPVIPLTGADSAPDLSNTNVKDMVASTNSEINDDEEDMNSEKNGETVYGIITTESAIDLLGHELRCSGAFIALEGVVYKNNIVFDSECKKLFDKLQKDLKMSNPDNPQESFKSMLNVQKNRYTFNFSNANADPNAVTAAIVGCAFKPIKENGAVVRYEKVVKGIKMTLEFTSIDNGIIISYQTVDGVVKESSIDDKLEYGLNCDSSDVKDAAKKLKKLQGKDDVNKEDLDEAIQNLDHAIENYKEVQKAEKEEKEVKESASFLVAKIPEYSTNKTTLIELLAKESSDDFVDERKDICAREITHNIDLAYATENTLGNYIADLLFTSPAPFVRESANNVINSIFNADVTEDVFTKYMSRFVESVNRQIEEESICEMVLNNIEFTQETFMEASEEEIDEDIKPIINLLNRLGYKVKYSCSGHHKSRIKEDTFKDGVYHGKMYTTARITFDKKYDFKSIPEGWYENKNSDKTAIYVRAFSYDKKDGTPNEAFEKWKSEYMASLKKWVEELDSAEDSDAKMESFIDSVFDDFTKGIGTAPVTETPSIDFDSIFDNEFKSLM